MAGDFMGVPLQGEPGTNPASGTHMKSFYDPSGNLKVLSLGLIPVWINGRERSLYVPVPPELQSTDPERPFIPEKFEPPRVLDPNTNFVTMEGIPDEPPAYVAVDFKNHTPGWTQDPKDPYAKYVASFDSNGDPVFGDPPAGTSGADSSKTAALAALGLAATYIMAQK